MDKNTHDDTTAVITEKKKKDSLPADFNGLMVKKSNDFIVSKYKSSLLEQKLVSIAITRLKVNKNGSITATIFPSELKEMLGKNKDDVHIYRDLKKVSKEMTGHVIEMEDGKGNFSVLSLITNADYLDGHFTMTFNNKMSEHVFNLKSHFTSYSLANALQLKSGYSYRFYELIKMDAYKITDKCPYVMHDYGVNELKFMVGVLDINDENARKCQDNGGTWDEMAEVCKEQMMKDWGSFKRRVLDKAKKELDRTADFTFDYNLIRSGKGGKVVSVQLIIHKNMNRGKDVQEKVKNNEKLVKNKNEAYEQMDIEGLIPYPSVLFTYEGHNGLTKDNLKAVYKAADNDMSLVVKAIDMADEASQNTVINNYVGWIIDCVKKKYDEPQMVIEGSSEKGSRVKKVTKELESMDKKDEDKILERYWDKAKAAGTEKFADFTDYLSENNMDLDMFEGIHTPAECGDLYIKWIKSGEIDLF